MNKINMIANTLPKLFELTSMSVIICVTSGFAWDEYCKYSHSKNVHKDAGIILSNYISKCHLIANEPCRPITQFVPINTMMEYPKVWKPDVSNVDFVKGLDDLKRKNPNKFVECIKTSCESYYKYVKITNYEDEIIVNFSESNSICTSSWRGITLY